MQNLLFIILATSLSFAASISNNPFDACNNLSAQDYCSYAVQNEESFGICIKNPIIQKLLCIPEFGYIKPTNKKDLQNHTITQSSNDMQTLQTNTFASQKNFVNIYIEKAHRFIEANGIPTHKIGIFPNAHNPYKIKIQKYKYAIPAYPKESGFITKLGLHNFGIALNGVVFQPYADEWYKANQIAKWQYEPLSGAIQLGLDDNHAHVNKDGAYHYHGLPMNYLYNLGISSQKHSPLVGWAADGFPIYALYGYIDPKDKNSRVVEMVSSYRIKFGKRETTKDSPHGHYDGTFVNDYVYNGRFGNLDRCNGRFTVTPEFPKGTYAYFLSENWPVIPRCYKGTPSKDFTRP